MIRVAALLLAGVLTAGAAQAQVDAIFQALPTNYSQDVVGEAPNLRFVKVPGPKGNTIIAWGGISKGDANRLAVAIQAAKPLVEIQFNSPGGDLFEGLALGRLIRRSMQSTRVTTGTYCFSACNFAFMGGVVRTIEPGGLFGVHMFRNQAAKQLVGDLRRPPRSVEEYNDRFPKSPLRAYVVEDLITAYNAEIAKPSQAPPQVAAPTAGPVDNRLVPDPLEAENKPRTTDSRAPIARDSPGAGGSGAPDAAPSPMTMSGYFRHPEVQEKMIDYRVRDIQQASAQIAAEIAWFLVEMRLSLGFLTNFAEVPSLKIRVLTPQELKDLNIVN